MKAPVIIAACAVVTALVFAARPAEVDAQGASSGLTAQCASCHALTKPANSTVDHLWTRKGPDLWYAGDKFNRDWLVGWLQNPIYYAHAQNQVVIRSLPGYWPSQVAMAAAFSEHTAFELLPTVFASLAYGAVLLALAVAVYGGASLTSEKSYLLGKFARVALGTRHIDYNGRLCMVSAGTAYKLAFGVDRCPNPWSDIPKAQVVLVAGSNVAECSPITTDYLWRMRDAGGRLIVVDPRMTPITRNADLYLPVRPGTDVVLACSYRVEDVLAALGDGRGLGARLRYVVEREPLGTGGGARHASDLVDGTVVVLNGDVLTDAHLGAMRAFLDAGAFVPAADAPTGRPDVDAILRERGLLAS